jgi:subtilisin family serine protease
MRRRHLATFAVSAAFAGCSGGGAGSHVTPPGASPVASPTESPTPVATAAAAGSTSYIVTSIPSGLTISYSDGANTQLGTTPIALSPPLSNVAFAITFVPGNGNAPYTFTGDQQNDGPHGVLYNQNADTSGSIGSIGGTPITAAAKDTTALARAAARAQARSAPRRRTTGAAGRPFESNTRVVVRYRAAAFRNTFVQTRGRRIGPEHAGVVAVAVDAPSGTSAQAYAATLRTDPAVVDAHPDVLEYLESSTAVMPNDTHFDDYQQWSLFATRFPNAWGYTEGSPSVAIAIIDTGIDFTNTDFSGSKVTYAESDIDGVTTPGAAAAQDTDGHGSNVAGIAAAQTDNAYGFAGSGFNTSLQIYRVFAADTAANDYAAGANASDISLAIYDAIANGARVINLSLGACAAHGFDVTQQQTIEDAVQSGVVVVAAAGNERSGTSDDPLCTGESSTIDFPASYDGVIAVGASALDDDANPGVLASAKEYVASYSNAGPGLALVAPGGDPPEDEADGSVAPDLLHWIDGLYSTTAANPKAQCSNPADCRALFTGTSQATPHVAGTAALLLAENPSLTVAQVGTILRANADDIGDPLEGSGRLDAYRALAAAAGDMAPPAEPSARNFVAFAYVPSGSTTPTIIDADYPTGVPVASDGTFRIVDLPANAPAYKIGVWYDANGDGVVDAGDYFGRSGTCHVSAPCASAAGIAAAAVTAGFVP